VVGGALLTNAVAEEPGWEDVRPSFGASGLRDLAASPDGKAWILEPGAGKIWRFDYFTKVATPFSVPGVPKGIALGSDGNMWFTEHSGNRIGRLSPDGTLWESATLSTPNSKPSGITLAPDGNLWFVEEAGNKLASITPAGVITEYPLPSAGAFPAGIAASSYFLLAITEPGLDKILFFNAQSHTFIDEQTVPTGLSGVSAIAHGTDSFFWFLEEATAKVGRAYPNVPMTDYYIPTGNCHPRQIAAAPDGSFWFAEESTGKLGHILPRSSADVNRDDVVDVADVFFLINFLFAGGQQPVFP